MRRLYLLCVLLASMLGSGSVLSRPIASDDIPFSLKPWVKWVLADQPPLDCPYLFNNNADRRCAWSTPMQIALSGSGGTFSAAWQVYAGSWVTLPGDSQHWPQDVTVDGAPATVTDRGGRPAIWLAPGSVEVQGRLVWNSMPESLWLPPEIGIVNLTIDGAPHPFPTINEEGRLWLAQGADNGAGADNDSLNVQVYRLITDEIPMNVTTRIELDVAGRAREVTLNGALLAEFIPLSLSSGLPARLEPDGTLRIQLRPGRWTIDVGARHPAAVTSLAPPQIESPWPEAELWSFDARNHLRVVDVGGVPQVDPNQTTLPQEWRQFPAFRIGSGETLAINVTRRGDPQPEPDRLSLNRQLWLDFDGGGYTFSDTIGGTMTAGWRLDLNAPMQLGRVAVDGQPQLITRGGEEGRSGVEVRRGALNLTADGRYEGGVRTLPAVGWDHDFQQVGATLHLPPGWKLFSVSGVDDKRSTQGWLHRWTMGDIFLVGITTVIVYYLLGWKAALLVLATFVLLWFEPGAPRGVWLNLIAAIVLLRILPQGRLRRLIGVYRTLSVLALLVIAVPFMVEQVRVGLFPQLEQAWRSVMPGMPTAMAPQAPIAPAPEAMPAEAPPATMEGGIATDEAVVANDAAGDRMVKRREPKLTDILSSDYSSQNYQEYDPKANVQTGPGLPRWGWTDVPLTWHGSVEKDQQLHLWLLSPWQGLVLNLMRVLLVALLALIFLRASFGELRSIGLKIPSAAAALVLALASAAALTPRVAIADEYPSPDLLNELRGRLLAAPECIPACAQSPRLRINVADNSLQLRLEIHATEHVAVPLPGSSGHWLPAEVTVDGAISDGLARMPSGEVWLRVGPGVHQVVLSGPLPNRSAVQLPLPMTPRRVELEQHAGWRIDGIHEDGSSDPQLMLTREGGADAASFDETQAATLPTFARVERTLLLGLEWRVQTRIVRLSAPDSAIVLEVPLLDGESITTDQVRVIDGKAQVSLSAQQQEAFFESVLGKREAITLEAPQTTAWTEVWRADISPVLHASTSGIPVVHHQNTDGNWLPEWRPWPGEKVTITLTRPQGVEGSTFTIDASELQYTPGERSTDVTLTMDVRSSQGGQHTITLPEGALLQSATINGMPQPIRQQQRQVTLPLTPGAQTFVLGWREPQGIVRLYRTSPVELGVPSVNASIKVAMPVDRWILLTRGPLLGPAVMFWGQLLVIVLIAWGLSHVPLTPLKFRHWLLLGIGVSQMPIGMALVVVVWLLALGLRSRWPATLGKTAFNFGQLGIVVLTVLALSFLVSTVFSKLEGLPEMQIGGNASTAQMLNWYQDHAGAVLPVATITSLPLTAYHLLMLAWALWLAFALVRWLMWGWRQFSHDGLWREFSMFRRRDLPPTDTVA